MPLSNISEFSSWFCLKEGRFNYEINPERDPRDQQFLFGKEDWKEQLHELLETWLLLRQPVRLVLWGQYGIGKTHRIFYLRHYIEEKKLPIYPVWVVCRDINDKSPFERLHFDLVNNIGREFAVGCVEEYCAKVREKAPGYVPLKELSASADIAAAFNTLGLPSDSKSPLKVAAAWKFLAGLDLDRDDMSRTDVTGDMLTSSVEYAAVLRVLGHVIAKVKDLHLVYLVDQVEALSRLSNKPAEVTWVETLRAILDLPEVGIVTAIGADHQDQLPRIMVKSEIVRRFRLSNYIEMAAFKRDDTQKFLLDLLREWTDRDKRDALALQSGWKPPVYRDDRYPFTPEAFDVFCKHFSDEYDPNHAKPSEIIDRLNRVAKRAFKTEKRLIDRTVLEESNITA
jgi:hypothetical protein